MNLDENRAEIQDDATSCFNCGSRNVHRVWKNQRFQYGSGESAVELNAEVPVYTCGECGFEFAGAEAEDVRHEAVCRHFGVLTPKEIVAIRESLGMSRNEFADCTGIGIASLKRWETGVLIQNKANDELVFLMTFPENVEHLLSRNRTEPLNLTASAEDGISERRHSCTSRFRGRRIQADIRLTKYAQAWNLR